MTAEARARKAYIDAREDEGTKWEAWNDAAEALDAAVQERLDVEGLNEDGTR